MIIQQSDRDFLFEYSDYSNYDTTDWQLPTWETDYSDYNTTDWQPPT